MGFEQPTLRQSEVAGTSVSYELLTQDGPCYDRAVAILAESFYSAEPLTGASGVTRASVEEFFAMLCPQMCDNGLSVVAVTEAGDVAGVFIANDFATPPPPATEAFVQANPEWGNIFAILDAVEEFMTQNCVPGGPKSVATPGIVCHQWCMAVAPEFGGRGIGGGLARAVISNAAGRGFVCSFAEATGAFSAKLLCRAGMDVREKWPYAEWAPEGVESPPFAAIQAPHDATRLLTVRHVE
eukprot:TRINITY_DN57_c0_g1_i1.p1 TRINITY_DN57_c0_g1~~TRINITY_DN57_c0_g1_i1.p1  ORF type:complete len:240 (+),score=21.71 TRINITY_DN57_c0_g1_i1:32-751(+)